MLRTLLSVFAVAAPFALIACDGGKPSTPPSNPSSGSSAPAAEPKITTENLDTELNKLDAEIAAQ